MNSVFYAETYHPIQAGSIDGTDVLPHDNAVYRALLSSSAGLYDPFGDPKATGDPYCSLFVGRLSHLTSEVTLRKAMEKYGRVKDLRLVRHIVTGASRGYAFVEFETERDMHRAYEVAMVVQNSGSLESLGMPQASASEAHHSVVDDSEIMVDYNRQQLMPGWIPRRLGGGLGGKKESGQLRFGGRERPFRAPLRPIPHEELKRLGIPPPPEGKYKSRFQVPSPPRRNRSSIEERDMHPDRTHAKHSSKRYSAERENSSRRSMDRKCHSHRLSSREAEDYSQEEDDHKERICHSKSRHSDDNGHSARSSIDVEDECEQDQEEDDHKERIRHSKSRHSDDKGYSARSSVDVEDECEGGQEEEHSHNRSNKDRDADGSRRRRKDKDERNLRSSRDGDEHSHRRSKDGESRSRKRSRDDKTRSSKRSSDHKESSNKHHRRHSGTSHSHHKRHRADSTSP